MKTNHSILSICSSVCIFWPSVALHCLEIRFKIIPEERNGGGMFFLFLNLFSSPIKCLN
jgi:hypothetical protein